MSAHAGSFSAAVAHAFVDVLARDITIDGDDGRHLARVRRLRRGEVITLADGLGIWRAYEIHDVVDASITVTAITEAFREPAWLPRITIAPALIAKNRFDDMVVAAVELGADAILPFAAHRSVVEWRGAKAEAAIRRLQRLAREAAMQCRRSHVPRVGAIVDAQGLGEQPGLVIAAADGQDVSDFAARTASDGGWTVVSGPEGGFDPVDLAALERLGPRPRLRLGPHILRAETAPLAAVAAFNTVRYQQS